LFKNELYITENLLIHVDMDLMVFGRGGGIGELYTFTILAIVIIITMLLLYSVTKGFVNYAGSQSSRIVELGSTQFTTILGNATGGKIKVEFSGNPPLLSNNGSAMCILRNQGGEEVIPCTYSRVTTSEVAVELGEYPPPNSLLDLRIPMGSGFVGSLTVSYLLPNLDLVVIPGTVYVNPGEVFNETVILGLVNNSTGWQYVVAKVNDTRLGSSLIPPGELSYMYGTITLRAPTQLPATVTLIVNVTINGLISVTITKSFLLMAFPGSPQVPTTCLPGKVGFGYVGNGTNPPQSNETSLLKGTLSIYPGQVDGSLYPIFTKVNLNLITGLLNVIVPAFYVAYYDVSQRNIAIDYYPYVTVSVDPMDYPPEGAGFILMVVSNQKITLLGLPLGYQGIIFYWPPPGKYSLGSFLVELLGDPVVPVIINGDLVIARLHAVSMTLFPGTWNNAQPLNVAQYLSGTYRYVGFGMYFSSGLLNALGNLPGTSLPLNSVTYPQFNMYWNYLCIGQ
jgi:hypothetical protein